MLKKIVAELRGLEKDDVKNKVKNGVSSDSLDLDTGFEEPLALFGGNIQIFKKI